MENFLTAYLSTIIMGNILFLIMFLIIRNELEKNTFWKAALITNVMLAIVVPIGVLIFIGIIWTVANLFGISP